MHRTRRSKRLSSILSRNTDYIYYGETSGNEVEKAVRQLLLAPRIQRYLLAWKQSPSPPSESVEDHETKEQGIVARWR